MIKAYRVHLPKNYSRMKHHFLLFILFTLFSSFIFAQENAIRYEMETSANASQGENAPFWLTANKWGLQSISPTSAYVRTGIFQDADTTKKFSYNYGIDVAKSSACNSSELIIQQAYAAIHYKATELEIGSRERTSGLQNALLSSCGGGLLWSGNARPLPEVCYGLSRFVTVFPKLPWLKVKAEISYGWLVDNGYQLQTVNMQNGSVSVNGYLHRKMAAIQLKGKSPWSFTFMSEVDVEFGGKQILYSDGQIASVIPTSGNLKHMLLVLIPLTGDKTDCDWYYGNYVGDWQGRLSYDLGDKGKLHAYLDNYFEDSSGFWKLNGFDGLWGLEYEATGKGLIHGALIEYYQSTNQSGPIEFRPADYSHTNIKYWAWGGDNYYNHGYYIGWSNYGMGMGSPLVTSPIYNKNGDLKFENTRVIAYHAAIDGYLTDDLTYRVLSTYRTGYGTMNTPYIQPLSAFSGMVELNYALSKVKGLTISVAGAMDRGDLTGNNYGINLTLRKKGLLGLVSKEKR